MKSEVEKNVEYYKSVLMKVALVTKCRESYDICVRELGIKSANELRRKAKRMGIALTGECEVAK